MQKICKSACLMLSLSKMHVHESGLYAVTKAWVKSPFLLPSLYSVKFQCDRARVGDSRQW